MVYAGKYIEMYTDVGVNTAGFLHRIDQLPFERVQSTHGFKEMMSRDLLAACL